MYSQPEDPEDVQVSSKKPTSLEEAPPPPEPEFRTVPLEVRPGSSFYSLLKELDTPSASIQEIVRAVRPHFDLGRITPGTKIRVTFPFRGTTIAQGLRRVSSGEPKEIVASSWLGVQNTFQEGRGIDVTGASSNLDYDPNTEEFVEGSAPLEVWVVDTAGSSPVIVAASNQPGG